MAPTVERYKAQAPELLEAIAPLGDAFAMKRDPATDYCVKFDKGWCGIHRDYGADFLGDACHFFPRITRALGDQSLVAATLSCPEITRLILEQPEPFARVPQEETRLPSSVKQYLPEGMSAEDAFAVHDRFIAEAANPAFSAEMNLLRAVAVASALDTQPPAQWQGASSFYFRIAESRIPEAEPVAEDPFNLTHALHGLMLSSGATKRPRLAAIRDGMAQVLGITLSNDPGFIATAPDAPARFAAITQHWRTVEAAMQPVLTRYLQAQFSAGLFPFAGLGATVAERMTIIAVRFATVKLALMVEAFAQQSAPKATETVRVIQTLARFLDHLADAELSLRMYRETGWTRDARLRGLVESEA